MCAKTKLTEDGTRISLLVRTKSYGSMAEENKTDTSQPNLDLNENQKSSVTSKKYKKTEKPNGGWGWLVVCGVSLSNMTTQAMISVFGLLFHQRFADLGIETSGASLILSVQTTILNLSGFITGPVIKKFSYRKVCVVGALLVTTGLLLTVLADSLWWFILTYSLFTGMGLGLLYPSTFVAINSYFTSRRGMAVGVSVAGTGVGQMLLPPLITFLLDSYGYYGTLFILAGISLHALLGATLYQPVEWHLKSKHSEKSKKDVKVFQERFRKFSEPKCLSTSSLDTVVVDLRDDEKPGEPPPSPDGKNSVENSKNEPPISRKRATASEKEPSISRKETQLSENGPPISEKEPPISGNGLSLSEKGSSTSEKVPSDPKGEAKKGACSRMWRKLAKMMDLELLKNYSFLNHIFGLGFCYVANQNIQLLFPFYLLNLNFEKNIVAEVMTTLSAADIIGRLLMPMIGKLCHLSGRTEFFVAAFLSALVRSVLVLQVDLIPILIVAAVVGFVRSAMVLNYNLSISEIVQPEALPAALGLHMVIKGVCVMAFGPLIGYVRDITDDYPLTIHITGLFLLVFPFLTWVLEVITIKLRKR